MHFLGVFDFVIWPRAEEDSLDAHGPARTACLRNDSAVTVGSSVDLHPARPAASAGSFASSCPDTRCGHQTGASAAIETASFLYIPRGRSSCSGG